MIGASSTWYAASARLRRPRSSAARASGEDGKELLGRVHDRVGLLGLEAGPVVDAPPRHRDGEHPGGLRSAHVERRVADVRRPGRIRAEALGTEEKRLGVGLVTLRFVATDDRFEEVIEPHAVERKLRGVAPLRRDHAEPAALLAE